MNYEPLTQQRQDDSVMNYGIAVIAGDGIVGDQAGKQEVLDATGKKYGFALLNYTELLDGRRIH